MLITLVPRVVSRVCEVPASIQPHAWSDDITKWPVREHRFYFTPVSISLFKKIYFFLLHSLCL